MNNSFNYKKMNFIIDIVYIFAILFAVYIVFKYLLGLLIPFIIGFILCIIAEPTVNTLCCKLKIKRGLSSVICILVILFLFSCIAFFFSAVFIDQIKELAEKLPDFQNLFNNIAQKDNKNIFEKVVIFIRNSILKLSISNLNQSDFINNLLKYSTGIFKTMPQIVTATIVTLAFSIILSSSFPMVKSFIKTRFGIKNRVLIHQIKVCSISVIKNYFKSYSILLLITFCELLIAFYVFKIKPVFALALLISLVDILPIFGIGTIMLPWAAILLITGQYQFGVIILSIYSLITIIRQIIEPKIVGDNIGLPGVVTLPIMFIGLNLFGLLGLFAGPAVATVIYSLHKKGYIRLWK